MIANGYVQNNNNMRRTPNAYEKLAEEEIDDIRKIVHEEMQKCNVKRMNEQNEGYTLGVYCEAFSIAKDFCNDLAIDL